MEVQFDSIPRLQMLLVTNWSQLPGSLERLRAARPILRYHHLRVGSSPGSQRDLTTYNEFIDSVCFHCRLPRKCKRKIGKDDKNERTHARCARQPQDCPQ